MNDRFIVFDVETPNSRNDRMSSIGITVIEAEKIIEEHYYLVNPETHFDSFNISLTGITPQAVAKERNFAQIWNEIEPIMNSGIKIAHFAQFDMTVLAKCMNSYFPGKTYDKTYACTCTMAKKLLPNLINHRLNTICDYLHIPLNHHNAQSDTHACAEILLYYIKNGANINSYIRTCRQ